MNLKYTSIFSFIMGILSLFLENTFYGHLDENNILQESYFLPLGWFCLFLSLVLFIVWSIRGAYRREKARDKNN